MRLGGYEAASAWVVQVPGSLVVLLSVVKYDVEHYYGCTEKERALLRTVTSLRTWVQLEVSIDCSRSSHAHAAMVV